MINRPEPPKILTWCETLIFMIVSIVILLIVACSTSGDVIKDTTVSLQGLERVDVHARTTVDQVLYIEMLVEIEGEDENGEKVRLEQWLTMQTLTLRAGAAHAIAIVLNPEFGKFHKMRLRAKNPDAVRVRLTLHRKQGDVS
jgi:hypothetical protein